MKKTTTVIALMLFASVGAFAQGVSGGIKAGLNLSNVSTSGDDLDLPSTSISPSFHGGVYVTAMFSKHIGVQPEVLYSSQGYKEGDSKLKLNYINIPVLFRYNVNDIFNIHAGPQFGILASAKYKVPGASVDYKEFVKSSDVSIAAGVGVDLPIKLNFSLRFVQGLSDVSEDSSTAKNFTLQASVGYKLFGN